MSTNWAHDIAQMHEKFGVNEAVRKLDKETLAAYLQFRIDFLHEELKELEDAFAIKDWDTVVDSLIDLKVVAAGTLDAFDVDANKAWDKVDQANMTKSPGVNPNRPNKFGLPDLIKPVDFVAPSHADNIGLLAKLD